jgi:hypothetical protein
MSAGTGVLAQLVSTTQIDDVITANNNPLITFFKAKSEPYAMFATDWQRLNFATSSPGSEVVETTADVVRSGDMLCHMYLVVKAPALVNVSAANCDISGATLGNTGNTSIKRGYVGAAQHTGGFGRKLYQGLSTGMGANDQVVVIEDVDLTERVPVGSVMRLTEHDTTAAVATSVRVVTITGVSYAANDTTLAFSDVLATFTTDVYTVEIYEPPRQALCGGNVALVSCNAQGVRAVNRLTSVGPWRSVIATNGIRRLDPVMDPGNFAAHYGTYAPVQLIKQISIVIGANTISTLTALVIQAHLELFTASDRLMRRMVNASRSTEELCAWAIQPNVWYVPIPFWFGASASYQSSLPLVALSFHTISINLSMQPYTRCIVNGCAGDMTDRTITMGGDMGSAPTTLETHAGPRFSTSSLCGLSDGASAATFASTTKVGGANFTVFLFAEYIYLHETERDLYTDMTDEVLINQWQYATDQSITSSSALEVQLRFNHPIQCLLFAGRLQSNVNDHRWGEYEGPVDPLSVSATLPDGDRLYWLREAQLKFNNSARTSAHGPEFFHQLMPSVAADRVPDSHIFYKPFCLSSPTGNQVSGSANFSRLDSATLTVTAHSHLFADQSAVGGLNGTSGTTGIGQMASGQKVLLEIAACNANTFTFDNGMGGPGYV